MTEKTPRFLCHRDEIEPGQMRAFVVDDRPVVLCRNGDSFTALQDSCPHHGARLSGGVLGGTNVSDSVGEYKFVRDGEILRCPRHGYEYGVEDGRSLHDRRMRVKTYRVIAQDDDVFIEL
jgi:nitrite reductase/ring-hydroxylating ferredoxin subunit